MGFQRPAYDAELISRLVSAYRIDASDCLSQIDDALAKDDVVAIAKASCALNRAASILYADAVCAVSSELEQAAHDGNLGKIPAMVQQLRYENARLIDWLSVGQT